jgi:hypothetical protein
MTSKLSPLSFTAETCKSLLPAVLGDVQLTSTRYLMVDVVVNNVMATSTNPDYSKFMFKDKVRGS